MMITKPIRNTFHHFSLFLALFPFLCLSSHVPFFLQSPADPPLFTARLCSLYALFFPLPYLSGLKKSLHPFSPLIPCGFSSHAGCGVV